MISVHHGQENVRAVAFAHAIELSLSPDLLDVSEISVPVNVFDCRRLSAHKVGCRWHIRLIEGSSFHGPMLAEFTGSATATRNGAKLSVVNERSRRHGLS